LFWETTAACNLACVHCRRLDVSCKLSKDDLNTEQALRMIRSLPQTGRPILVFSGGEPLMRPDLLELAAEATQVGLPIALATNGTIMNENLAKDIVDVGFQRVSMSLDGPSPATHDVFRGIDGAFDSTIRGFKMLRKAGMSMQINTTVTQRNVAHLDEMYQLALDLGADALHMFMLVPVGCGMTLSDDIKLNPDEYEDALNWIYDRSVENKIHIKATCAPHYFRVLRQRSKKDGRPMPTTHGHPSGHVVTGNVEQQINANHGGSDHHGAPSGGGVSDGTHMTAMTKGCLAGQSVCFVSHTGQVFPCGYLPVECGNVKNTAFPEIWANSTDFAKLRDPNQLEGKCGACEYKQVCMGCRARAYADSHDFMAQEPECNYIPMRLRGETVCEKS
ncbi:MAG: radical SAM protein, partial [Phycisphaeraceae bacterium]|nr:radical SAM protein [Phycisphaeraceae bacterium]